MTWNVSKEENTSCYEDRLLCFQIARPVDILTQGRHDYSLDNANDSTFPLVFFLIHSFFRNDCSVISMCFVQSHGFLSIKFTLVAASDIGVAFFNVADNFIQ